VTSDVGTTVTPYPFCCKQLCTFEGDGLAEFDEPPQAERGAAAVPRIAAQATYRDFIHASF
jgi:hypothetical protein